MPLELDEATMPVVLAVAVELALLLCELLAELPPVPLVEAPDVEIGIVLSVSEPHAANKSSPAARP